MYPYKFSVSLRLKHPNMDPAIITRELHRRPTRAWKAGDARRTPSRTELPGHYRETYWYRRLTPGGISSSKGATLEAYLARLRSRFQGDARFFRRVRGGGGNAELFVGIFGRKNYGFELPAPLIADLGRIGLSLSFDIYDYRQHW